VGQWGEDGCLTLIDRIKNLVKLSGGEYIALERLESVYKACNLITNICIWASSDIAKPIAIVVSHDGNLKREFGSEKPVGELVKDKPVNDKVLNTMNAIGKKNGFKPMELLQAVIITTEEWTPENGLTTAAQKIQRKAIEKKFKNEIDAIWKGKN
jgi:long-chain acyl-CoA synthetase